MDYSEARAFLKEKEALGSVYGLSVMRELLRRLGNPEKKLSVIHVAGTNGKGSAIAFTASILKEAGFKVGCYTSPAVFSYEEIIRVGDEFISKEAVARLMSRIKEAAKEMVRDGFSHPTVFEMETAMAFSYFAQQKCELVCMECGLGGELDATNVIENPVCAAFTSISRDHIGILGSSLSDIAEAKAGIIKPGAYVVSVEQEEEVREVLVRRAEEKECRLRFGRKIEGKIKLGLFGLYQRENAALAIEIIEGLRESGYEILDKAVQAGLARTRWPGRLQKVSQEPDFYLDGAHNGGARGLDKNKLAECAGNWYREVYAASSYKEAIETARKIAGTGGVVLAFGSLSYLGEIGKLLAGEKNE